MCSDCLDGVMQVEIVLTSEGRSPPVGKMNGHHVERIRLLSKHLHLRRYRCGYAWAWLAFTCEVAELCRNLEMAGLSSRLQRDGAQNLSEARVFRQIVATLLR
jgi:hypothetical protein